MSKPLAVMVSAMVLATIVAAGCRKEQAAPPPDPRAEAKSVLSLTFDGAREQFLARLDGTVAELTAAGALFNYTRANMNFRKAFIQAYGKTAWEKFGTGSSDPDSDKRLILDEIDKSELRIDGDQATLAYKKPGASEPSTLRLVKFDNGWKVKASSFSPPGEKGDKTVAVLPLLTAIIGKYQRAIGKPGIKPQDITYELSRESEELFGKTHNEPHRFNIDQIK